MADRTRERRFAILIDADSASHRIAAGLFKEIARFGEANVRRIYGDFANPRLKSWAEILPKYAIDPIQQFPYTSGKNACDIALTIDAMDLLHSGRFDGFCLVSSDSDFTRLASRLREQGLDIYGFGAQKTPESFRQACRRFIYTEILLPEAPGAAPRAALDAKAIPAFGTETLLPEEPVATPGKALAARTLHAPGAAVPILTGAIEETVGKDGWVGLGEVGQRLLKIDPDFDRRSYGCKRLSDLIRKTGAFEVDQSDGLAIRIRAKPAQTSDASLVCAETVTSEQPVP